MPKERVHHGKSYPVHEVGEEPKEPTYSDVTPSLDVWWGREPEGRVQVAIEFSREQWLTIAKDLQANESVAARAIFTDNLSRADLNHMIRTLRRARDAAHGVDE